MMTQIVATRSNSPEATSKNNFEFKMKYLMSLEVVELLPFVSFSFLKVSLKAFQLFMRYFANKHMNTDKNIINHLCLLMDDN